MASQFPGKSPRGCTSAKTAQITVYTGKAEVGQNIRTSLTQVVAEELHAAPASIHLVMADTQLTPFDMGTFGSRTTPDMSQRLRRTAAAAREMLIDLAAESWKTDRALLKAAERQHRPLRHRAEARIRQADQRPEAHQDRGRRDGPDPAGKLDDRRPFRAEGRRPRVRDRQTSICVRHQAAGHAVRQSAAAAVVRCNSGVGRSRAAPSRCRAWSWSTTAISSASPHRAVCWPRVLWRRSRPSGNPGPGSPSKDLYDNLKSQGRRARGGRDGNGQRQPARSRRTGNPPTFISSRLTRSPTSPTRRSSRARRLPVGGRQAHGLDRNSAALRRARRAHACFRRSLPRPCA